MPAGQPKVAGAAVAVLANTYNTLMNVTAEGSFSTININTTTADIDNMTIKITIDGVVALELLISTDLVWRTVQRDISNAWQRQVILDWGGVKFDTSLKIEYKNVNATTVIISCFYQIYP